MIEIAIYLAPNCHTIAGPKEEIEMFIKKFNELYGKKEKNERSE